MGNEFWYRVTVIGAGSWRLLSWLRCCSWSRAGRGWLPRHAGSLDSDQARRACAGCTLRSWIATKYSWLSPFFSRPWRRQHSCLCCSRT